MKPTVGIEPEKMKAIIPRRFPCTACRSNFSLISFPQLTIFSFNFLFISSYSNYSSVYVLESWRPYKYSRR